MNRRLVLVDGYNIIRNDPALSAIEKRSLEAGRKALISRLLTTFNHQQNEVTVVFDGAAESLPQPSTQRVGDVHVVFSRLGESADDVIRRLATMAAVGRQVLVLSDDHEVRAASVARGGQVGGAADRRPARPTGAIPSKDELDNRGDGRRATEKKGNPRRAKRQRRQPPDVRW